MSEKVHIAGAEEGPTTTIVVASNGPDYPSSSYRSKQVSGQQNRRVWGWRHILYALARAAERAFNGLSSRSQQTIRAMTSLYAVLYIFLTVPFRIAFYYDPGRTNDSSKWTTELSIYAVMDAVVDVIGLFEFLQKYRLGTSLIRRLSRSGTISIVNPTVSPSSKNQRRRDMKWTLALIERAASMQGHLRSSLLFQRQSSRLSKLETVLEVVALLPLEIVMIADIYADHAFVQQMSSVGIKSLVRNIVMCTGLCHYVACGYMLIAHVQCGISAKICNGNVDSSWLIRDGLSGATVARKYARTLYWATRTILLLGFDDVTPVSNADMIYVILITIMGALFVSSLLASFLFIFRFWNARDAAFATHVDNGRAYMRSKNIPHALRRQVIEYFTYSWNSHHSLESEEALQLMPKHLQLKVVSIIKASRIKQVCFLAKESVEIINLLAAALIRRVYSPSDTIIKPKFNAQMFFVIRGRVTLSAFNGANPKECQTGEFFADICLLFPEKFEEKAVAKTFCELYALTKEHFDATIADFYREKEEEVRDRMAETTGKYLTQLRKTKKLLGMRGRIGSSRQHSSGRSSFNDMEYSNVSRRKINWKMPGSTFRVYWDTARLVAILYVAFEVPYFSVFISMAEEQQMLVEQLVFGVRYFISMVIEIFFGVNLVLRSRYLAHLDPVVMLAIEDPTLIFEAYKADGFYFDLIAWLPIPIVLETLATALQYRYPMFLRFLRLLRLYEVPDLLRNVCEFFSMSSKTHLVISLLLGVAFLLHAIGCLWFEMAWVPSGGVVDHTDVTVLWNLTRADCLQHATLFGNCSWVTFDCYAHLNEVFPAKNPQSTYQASFAYLRSIYWAIVTLTTVGYGDITAYSTGESFLAALWIYLGGIINFGIVGAMSSTISNAMAPRRQHIVTLNTLSSTLESIGISDPLSSEIRRFYHLQFVGRKQVYESQLLSNLPDQLCYEISSMLHSEAVKCIELFDSASIEFLREVTGKFRHRSYQNGDTICLEGDRCREFFVFLRGSKANVFFRSRKVPVRALHEGHCYGVNEFLLKRAHTATLIAASLVHASVMTRDQFDTIQRKFDDDLRDMKEEAQCLLVEQNSTMRRIVRNLEKLKLQSHLLSSSSLFYHGDSAITPNITSIWSRSNHKGVRDSHATRNLLTKTWNGVITCWNLYNAVFVIFRICFHVHLEFSSNTSIAIWITDLLCDLCYAMDIYLQLYYIGNFEVGIDNLVTRKEQDKRYFHSTAFKWNIVASLPLYVPYSSGSLSTSLCRLPRLIRCLDLWTYLDDIIVQAQQHFASRNVSAYLSPIKLMIILVLVAHHAGCIFFWISERECEHANRCWINDDKLLKRHQYAISMLYAKSFYWAITTLLLAGSREIVPRSTAATMWTGFTCLCCTFIIGHIVGEISDLIQELGKEAKQYKNRLANFNSFAKKHELPDLLTKRVSFFFRDQFEHSKGGDIRDTIQDLSANLRLKLMIEVYGVSISLLPICHNFTYAQINNLALRLRSEHFIPGDTILVEGTFGGRLCILRKGQAAAFWTHSVTSVAVLLEGALFGEIAFFLPDQKRLATVRATTMCEVLYATKYDWEELWATNGDVSDVQIQEHAQLAILDWVSKRMHRYQQFSLKVASNTQRLLSARLRLQATATAAVGTAKAKNKLSAVLSSYRETTDPLFSAPTDIPVVKTVSTVTAGSQLPSDMQLLEKKAEYLILKTNKCVKQFHPVMVAMRKHRQASSVISNRTHSRSFPSSKMKRHSRAFSEFYHSMIGDPIAPIARGNINDIHALQFIIDTNPVSKHLRENLSDENLQSIEAECWARFKLLVVAQFRAQNLLERQSVFETFLYKASPSASASKPSQLKIRPARNKLSRMRSFRHDEHANRKYKLQRLLNIDNRRSTQPNTAISWNQLSKISTQKTRLPQHKTKGLGNDQQPRIITKDQDAYCQGPSAYSIQGIKRKKRSNSLPYFGHRFFKEISQHEDNPLMVHSTRGGLDFGLLQYSHRAKQQRFRSEYKQQAVVPKQNATSHYSNRSVQTNKAISKDISPPRAAISGLRMIHLPFFDTKEVLMLMKRMEKVWDLIMLIISLYHLLVTTFKVCFSTDLAYLSVDVLRSWSAFEIVLDVLCLLDVAKKVYLAHFFEQNNSSTKSDSRRMLTSEQTIRVDAIAMLPLELLLFIPEVRFPLEYISSAEEVAEASWWVTRSLLRVNRLLLIQRVSPLFEKLLESTIDSDKILVNEALLYFLQGLATYLTMGHLLACIWFFTGKLGYVYTRSTESSEVVHMVRILAEDALTLSTNNISITENYVRSLLFAMECISTLFYGDILSMNPVEAVAEMGITLWSIYIYGGLVGAQGELFVTRARREAAFEQTLGQIQHYLVENDVPIEITNQVKAYYTRLWHRRKGEAEFKAVEQVPRALYEDVVLSTLCQNSFAVQVQVFEAMDDIFLRALLVCLQYVVCSENEEVYMAGDMDRSMYFISQGRVLIKMGVSDLTRERGEFFGELALLYGISRLETSVALTVTELYRLDHEPYERLLLDFPEYRARNKLAWTTASSGSTQEGATIVETLKRFQQSKSCHPGRASKDSTRVPSLLNITGLVMDAGYIDAQLPHSYIYRSSMELLSRLSKVDPMEAKNLYMKGRDGARRQLKTALGIVTARPEPNEDDVRSFYSHSSSPTAREVDKSQSENLEQLEAALAELPTQNADAKKPLERRSSTTAILQLGSSTFQQALQLRRGSSVTIRDS
ncbi:unnamed protein product [Phytophthora lilii]|uniref:Unnamed protein product n=1 Tax=Phytophthora lilii TaxID=2077276 RepID=A0A9W6TM31_9STRA|nr:unnamed protein product [Phytophthora lilii]